MAKVERRHTCTIVHNYDIGDCPILEKMFSIWVKARFRREPFGMYYDAQNKDLYLPSGMDQYYIERNFYGDIFIKYEPDKFDKLSMIQMKIKPRDERQVEALKFCVGADQYAPNRERSQIFLNLHTGVGKTFVAIAVFAFYRVKTMMITYSLDWIQQWKERILQYTDVREDEIYIIAGKASIVKLMNGLHDPRKIKFYLVSHDTISSYAKANGWNRVHDLFKMLRIGIKIYDESHLYFDNTMMIDNFSDVWKTYYLTATPMRSDRDQDRIYQRSYEKVPKLSLFDEDKDPHTEYISIHFNSNPTPFDISACQNMYGFNRNKYTDYLVTRPNYFKILRVIMEIISTNTSPEGKVLVYIGTNYAIGITYNWLHYYFPQVPIGIYTSAVPKEMKRAQLDNKIILSTTKSAGEALDLSGLEMTIVLNEPFKSPKLAIQSLGRTRAKDTKYIEVVDNGFKAINAFFRAKQSVFETYATQRTKIKLSQEELDRQVNELDERDKALMQNVNQQKLKTVVKFVR